MTTRFCELPIGARFEFRGRRYEKLALSLAGDEERCGNIFQDQTEVFWDRRPGEQPRTAGVTPQSARPDWKSYLSPAPGQCDRGPVRAQPEASPAAR